MKLQHILFLLLVLLPSMAHTQDGYTYNGITYSMAVPMGGTEDYINAGSYRGANFEGCFELSPNFAVGWLFGWNVFNIVLRNETYTNDNFTLTGNQYRYQNEFPMLVRGLYLLGAQDGIRPYLGAGLGVIYNVRRTDIGLYSIKTDAWHFAMAPELGIMIPVNNVKITNSIRYNYGVQAREIGQQGYISFNFGILFSN